MRPLLILGALVLLSVLPVFSAGASDYHEYLQSVDRAIQSGEGAAAIDLMCEWNKVGDVAEYGRTHSDTLIAAFGRWVAFQHRRYAEVFQPPSPVESYFAMPQLSWEKWGLIASAFGGVHGTDQGENYNDGKLVISDSLATVTVDIDHDGEPEMTFRGQEPEFAPDVAVVHDDAKDGRRHQWLAAPQGSDPRTAAAIWLYRDGAAIAIIVKPLEGHTCGRSWCFGYGL